LFNNIYTDEIITKRQTEDLTGISLSKNQQLFKLLFTDDQVVISSIEDNLQKTVYK